MGRAKRIEVTVEADRMVVIRRRRGVVRAWCEGCAQPVKMITVDEAAVLVGVTARTIYRWVEKERLHFTETSGGSLLICLNSLGGRTSV